MSYLKLSAASACGARCCLVAVLFLSGGVYFAEKSEKNKGYLCTENFISLLLSIENAGTKEIGTFCWSIVSVLLFTFQVPNSIASVTISGIRGVGVKSPGRKLGGRELQTVSRKGMNIN